MNFLELWFIISNNIIIQLHLFNVLYQEPNNDNNKSNTNDNSNNNSIQFFILTCWLNSNKSQLQSQHKKIINPQKYAYA
jgi:hypothetical protein